MSSPLGRIFETLDFLSTVREANDIKLWSRMLEKIAAALRAEAATYYYYDTLAKQLVAFYRLGENAGTAPTPVAIGSGISGWVAKFRESVVASDAAADKRYLAAVDDQPCARARDILCVPLSVNLDFVGVFSFLNKDGGTFSADDLKLAESLCAQAAVTLRRLRLEEMVNRVTTYNSSILDNLSGGFLAVDVQGRVMICNPAARRILGIQGEVTDLPVEQALVHLPDLAAVMRRTLSTKVVVKRQDLSWTLEGKKKLLGYSTLVIQDTQGNFTGAGVTFQDITPANA